jgi:nifR3 family TIM-barrel protein
MRKVDLGESILAPMAGITGFPFRKIALKYGAEFCFTEMISAAGFLHNDRATLELLETGKDAGRTGIQLFGSVPGVLAQASKKAADKGFKVIDINMGCPVKKVVKTGAGSAILKDIKGFSLIVKSVRQAAKDSIFTIKIRSGFDESSVNFMEIGRIAELSGVDAIFFHPRTRSLMFGGNADHSLTKSLKSSISIPVYASGDIFSAADALKIKCYTGADGVMFARGAIGKPWIFSEYLSASGAGEKPNPPDIGMNLKIDIIAELMEEMNLFYGKERGYNLIRPHLYNFLKGFKGSKGLRLMVNNAKNEKELSDILNILRAANEEGKN